MAKYTVRKGDNPLKLATQFRISPQKLLQTNGIQSLTAGQTIKIPQFNQVGGGANRSVGYGYSAPVPSMTVNPYTGSNSFGPALPPISATTAPFMTQSMLPPQPMTQQQILAATNGQTVNSATSAMALGQNTVIPQNNGIFQNNMTQNQNNTTTGGVNLTLPQNYVYGSDPELDKVQRLIWNKQADPNWTGGLNDHVRVLSRDEVWNRKANQRRRQQENSPIVTPATPSGNATNSSLSWRIG